MNTRHSLGYKFHLRSRRHTESFQEFRYSTKSLWDQDGKCLEPGFKLMDNKEGHLQARQLWQKLLKSISMNNILKIIKDSQKNGKLIGICLKRIVWENRQIGIVKIINEKEITISLIDRYSRKLKDKKVSISDIKYIEMGGQYLEGLENLYKSKIFNQKISVKYVRYYNDKHAHFLKKISILKENKNICTFFLGDNYITGKILDFSENDLLIKGISFNGIEDSIQSILLKQLTTIRYNGKDEIKIEFLNNVS